MTKTWDIYDNLVRIFDYSNTDIKTERIFEKFLQALKKNIQVLENRYPDARTSRNIKMKKKAILD